MKKAKDEKKLPEALVLIPPTESRIMAENCLAFCKSVAAGIRGRGGRAAVDTYMQNVITDANPAQIVWALRWRAGGFLWRIKRADARERRLLAKEETPHTKGG